MTDKKYQDKVHHLRNEAADKAQSISNQIEDKLKNTSEKLDELQKHAEDMSHKAVEYVKHKPVISLGIAIACGFLIGKIFR